MPSQRQRAHHAAKGAPSRRQRSPIRPSKGRITPRKSMITPPEELRHAVKRVKRAKRASSVITPPKSSTTPLIVGTPHHASIQVRVAPLCTPLCLPLFRTFHLRANTSPHGRARHRSVSQNLPADAPFRPSLSSSSTPRSCLGPDLIHGWPACGSEVARSSYLALLRTGWPPAKNAPLPLTPAAGGGGE